MATTTNYAWETPDDTDLVKDGAAAIRTLGSSIDTTTKALNPSTTLGDIEYRSSTANTNTRLGIGSSGQVLAVSGGVPAWTTVGSGSYTLISTTTLASAAATITFDSIAGTYQNLQIMWNATGADDYINLRFNNVTTSTYYSQLATISGTSLTAAEFLGISSMRCGVLNSMSSGIITIPNYKGATLKKTFVAQSGRRSGTSTNDQRIFLHSGSNDATTAITRVDIISDSNFGIGSSFSLYGVS